MYGGDNNVKELHGMINRIWKGIDKFPEEVKVEKVAPVYKKRNEHEASNYKEVILMNTGYKVYAEILRRRLEREMEE